MICHDFKGGIGTSSRQVPAGDGLWTVGVLVQANYGSRRMLRIDGVPIGEEMPLNETASPRDRLAEAVGGAGSIIIVVATDAPLVPHQCKRLAQRATISLARTGGFGSNGNGDLFLAFSTGNRGIDTPDNEEMTNVRCFPNSKVSGLFEATMEASEEAIANAMCMATTMIGINGRECVAIPLDRLASVMKKHGRLHPV